MARAPVPAVRSNLSAGNEILFGFLEAARTLFERRRTQGRKSKDDDKDQPEESREGVRDSSAPRRRGPPAGMLGLGQIIAEQRREFDRKRPGFLKSKSFGPAQPLNKPVPAKKTQGKKTRTQRFLPAPRPVDPRRAAFDRVVGGLFREPGTRNLFFDREGSLRTGLLSPEALSTIGGRENTFEEVIERFTQVEQIRENPRLRFRRPPTSTFVRPSVNALFGGEAQPSIDPLLNIGFTGTALSGSSF